MKKYFDRLGRPDAINWVTGVVALALMLPAAFISAGVDFTGRELEFTAIVLLRVAVMLAIFALGKAALVVWAKYRPQPLITLVTFLLAMVVATTIFDALLVVTGFTEQSALALRLRTTLVGTSMALILSSLLVTYARDFSRSNAELVEKFDELQRSKADAAERILARKAQLISTIQESVNAELSKFRGGNAVADSTVMQTLIDDVVRPLSYSLNRDFPGDEAPASLPSNATIDWARVARSAVAWNPFRWFAFPVGIVVISGSFLIFNFGLGGVLATVALLAIGVAVFGVFSWLWHLLPERLPTFLRAALFTAAHIPFALASASAITVLSGFDVLQPIRFWSFVAISVLISWAVTLVSATLRLLRETNLELQGTVDDLKREVIGMNSSYRQLHKGISRLLHGPVQEAITSSMLRLKARFDTPDTSEYAVTIRERIAAALELLDAPAVPHTDLSSVLEELKELWSGVVSINYVLSSEDLGLISQDQTAAYSVAELVREACSNATRHGQANQIEISLSVVVDQRAVDLVVDNDGVGLSRKSRKGIGSQLFDEQTLSWSRKKVGSVVRVQARVPLSQEIAGTAS